MMRVRLEDYSTKAMSVWNGLSANRLLVDVSLWSGDLAHLGDAVKRLDPYVDGFHVDVADAHFAPQLLFFPDIVAALRPLTAKPFHVHLMVDDPTCLIDDFADAGADLITIHYEIGDRVPAALERIRGHELAAGLAFQLDTLPEAIVSYLDQIDLVVMMGTELGIKGVGLSEQAVPRLRGMRRLLAEHGAMDRIKIEADGGLRTHTVPDLRAAGADAISPGSLIFKSDNLADTFEWLWSLPGPADIAG
ncbi:MAG: Ribulose-phosphate 3-epimerase [Anaerolineales bacterium]|nr:Ribulose-phosphate 3-epimerase [Anaerolineales bacterium]